MNNSYDQIATVTIDIATTIVDSTSFDGILIVGPLPKVTPEKAPAKCGKYSDISEVVNAGWVTSGDDADPVGIAARIAFSQDPTLSEVYIAPIQVTEEGTPEYITDTVERAMATSGWYVVCPVGVEYSDIELLAEYIETQEKMMAYSENAFFGAGDDDEDKPSISNIYNRTYGIFCRESSEQEIDDIPEVNNYMHVAFTVAWLCNESGSETAAFKALSSVYPASLTSQEQQSLKDNCVNYFTTVGNKNVTMVGKVLNDEWCDIIRFRDWLKNDMQVAVVSLFLANPKIPYTDAGIALIENAVEASLKRGQAVGGIALDEYDEDGNVTPGYKISVPRVADMTDSQRASRELSGIKFTAKLTGAIHFAEITGSLAYSL